MTTVYIAGPMTGLPDYNYPAFHAAALNLHMWGHAVVNPAESVGVRPGWEWPDYLRASLRLLLDCTGVALLTGWEHSKGAQLETSIARQLGMDIRPVEQWKPTP